MSRRKKGRGRGGSEFVPEVATPERGAPRRPRVERDVHEQMVGALGGMRDPRLTDVVVTRVELTDDLSFARVFVRAGPVAGANKQDVMRGLASAAGRLRREMSQALQLRRAPELRFIYDEGLENAERVEAILDELRDDE